MKIILAIAVALSLAACASTGPACPKCATGVAESQGAEAPSAEAPAPGTN